MIILNYLPTDNAKVYALETVCFSNEKRSLSVLEKTANLNNFVGLVAEESGEIVGYVTSTYCLDEAEIITVAVSPNFRKTGVATKLIESLISSLKNLNVNTLFLEVRESNLGAISLYEKLGFTKLSVRKNYYNGIENAVNYRLSF